MNSTNRFVSSLGSIAVLALLVAVAAAGAVQAGATPTARVLKASPAIYQYLAGTGPLCDLPLPNPCPTISRADNGDMIEITGAGTFGVFPKSVTGGGTFVHKAPDGSIRGSGDWTALKLIAFQSYGNAVPQGLPENFFGGRALILVQLLVGGNPVFTAVLEINCELGTPPPGTSEGVKLTVQGLDLNFNKHVSGLTLFILT